MTFNNILGRLVCFIISLAVSIPSTGAALAATDQKPIEQITSTSKVNHLTSIQTHNLSRDIQLQMKTADQPYVLCHDHGKKISFRQINDARKFINTISSDPFSMGSVSFPGYQKSIQKEGIFYRVYFTEYQYQALNKVLTARIYDPSQPCKQNEHSITNPDNSRIHFQVNI